MTPTVTTEWLAGELGKPDLIVFDATKYLPNPPPREEIEAGLNALIAAGHPVRAEWVDEAVLDATPELVRTLSVQPPRGAGRVRLLRIGAGETPVDLQPCGGTHVANTAEIGRVQVVKIENKGKQNRRIIIALEA